MPCAIVQPTGRVRDVNTGQMNAAMGRAQSERLLWESTYSSLAIIVGHNTVPQRYKAQRQTVSHRSVRANT